MSQRVTLDKQTMRKLIFRHYGLSVVSLKEMRGIYQVVTDQGTYAFKNAQELPDLAFIHDCLTHIRASGFARMPALRLSHSRQPAVLHDGESYYLEQWIEAREFGKGPARLEPLGAALADFHRASRGLEPSPDSTRYAWGERPRELLRWFARLEEWQQRERPAEAGGYEREMLDFLKYRCGLAYSYVRGISYPDLRKSAPQSAVLCHGSLHQKNILIDDKQNIWFIDFESMTYAERVLDLAQLLHYHAPPHEWDAGVVRRFVQSYESRHGDPLAGEEWSCLMSYLSFPRRLYNSAQNYFGRPQPERKAYMKLKKIIEQEWSKERFLKQCQPGQT